MRKCSETFGLLVTVMIQLGLAQVPPRLHIPGAVLVGNYPTGRQQRLNTEAFSPVRPRRPIPHAVPIPIREVRPVVEEETEEYAPPSQSIASFDAEVDKLSLPALATAVKQVEDEEAAHRPSPIPVQFRPEKAVPVTRDQIRAKPVELPSPRPSNISPKPLPVLRQEPRPVLQNRPVSRPIRPVVRQEIDDEEEVIPRQVVRQKVRQQQVPVQQFRPAPRPAPRPYNDDNDLHRKKKPVVQILRKYRTDNPDGSITWGFENEDGTFKEETLGTDCIIKGKYGYVDPEGERREYSYEAGNKCDQQDQLQDEEELPPARPQPQPKKNFKPQVQFRPQLAQY